MEWRLLAILFLVWTTTVCSQNSDDESTGEAPQTDPCADLKCSSGEECVIRGGKAACECIDECPAEWNDYPRSLCTTEGFTFRHECDLWRAQCLCQKGDSRCTTNESGKKPTQFTIQYFDECRDLKSLCDWDREKAYFSLRMSMWFRELFTVKWSAPSSNDGEDESLLRPLNAQSRDKASKLLNQNVGNATAVPGGILSYWFCEIDRDNSNSIDRTEMTRLTQLLSPSTPCLDEFLNSCGAGSVSYEQWHSCFGVASDDRSACNAF